MRHICAAPTAGGLAMSDARPALPKALNDQNKKSLITAYQFIAPSLLTYDFSPNQWHHPTVSFPIKGQKYFEIYKNFFITIYI